MKTGIEISCTTCNRPTAPFRIDKINEFAMVVQCLNCGNIWEVARMSFDEMMETDTVKDMLVRMKHENPKPHILWNADLT